MTRRLPWLITAVAVYQAIACSSDTVPRITHIVHVTRAHFKPHCEGCCCVAVRSLPRIPPPRYGGS